MVSPVAGLLSTTLAVLTGSPVSLDLSCQQWLIQLAGNIFSGMSSLHQESNFIKYRCFLLTVLVELCSMKSPSWYEYRCVQMCFKHSYKRKWGRMISYLCVMAGTIYKPCAYVWLGLAVSSLCHADTHMTGEAAEHRQQLWGVLKDRQVTSCFTLCA